MKLKTILILTICLAFLFTGCTNSGTGAPEGMKRLTTDEVKYNLYIPNDWTGDMSTGTASAYVSSEDRSNISLTVFELEDKSMTLKDYWKQYENAFSNTFSDMEYVGENPVSLIVGGTEADKYVYTASVTGEKYQFMQTVFIAGGQVYVFTYTALPDNYEKHLDDVNSILENFSFN